MTQTEQETEPKAQTDPRLASYFRAGYPLLFLVTAEEGRAEKEVLQAAIHPLVRRQAIFTWSATEGLKNVMDNKGYDEKTKDPKAALETIKASKIASSVYVMRDLHAFFGSPHVVRLLRDFARDGKQIKSTMIVLTPVAKLPPELMRDAVQIEFELPSEEQIAGVFDGLLKTNKKTLEGKVKLDEDERERIISAAMGLTTVEAENAFAKAIVEAISGMGELADLVLREKANAVKKSGVLEYFKTTENAASIGGLDVLKRWLQKRSKATTKKAREFGLPAPKGILLTGVPGSGKSLAAKAASNILQVPLIRFDISRVFSGLVGASEELMRNALQTIDALGSAVCWVDELEKAFAGASGTGANDSGVTRRVFGTFLTWMQEKNTPSFIVATTNSIAGIPPEMLRRGRFDENFFVGLPNAKERAEIFRIHLKKRKRDHLDIDLEACIKASNGFTGAEIEYSIIDGLYTAFDQGRELATEDVLHGIGATNPISKAFETELKAMIGWAQFNALNASLPTGHDEAGQAGRTLTLD